MVGWPHTAAKGPPIGGKYASGTFRDGTHVFAGTQQTVRVRNYTVKQGATFNVEAEAKLPRRTSGMLVTNFVDAIGTATTATMAGVSLLTMTDIADAKLLDEAKRPRLSDCLWQRFEPICPAATAVAPSTRPSE